MEKIIQTPRLTLRPIRETDFETTYAYTGDLEGTKYMVFLPHKTPDEARKFLREAAQEWAKPHPGYFEFAVLLQGKHIGGVALTPCEEEGTGELGWILQRAHWGKGYATEAAQALVGFAREIGLQKLIAHCDHRNTGSYRVMEHLGMALEKTGVRPYQEAGAPVAEYQYALTL
ncbi:GNAT family N-acetyltransferase [Christensenellaceae bacterium NSJ-44]|uniref:GNAT family N-acetyltransferase n=1 Tax=Luoshenia tenuis TaxID=2763654 RepID=A0A926D095_9FIRM|nr:GNAT family N-acetyltransferase [Luoshenia tenuis]MBC8529207.1 GNAT family N-acetyltransferase [Luoshenia tenuis]